MRSILLYSSEFLPFKGGVARYTADMAAMLSDGGFARVVVVTETPERADDECVHPYRVVRMPTRRFGWRWVNLGVNAVGSLAVDPAGAA